MLRELRSETDRLRHTLAHLDEVLEHLGRKLRQPDQQLRLSLIGGTGVWAAYLLINYSLTSVSCRWGWFGLPDTSSLFRLVETLIAVVALVLVIGAAWLGFNQWRRTPPEGTDEHGATRASRITMLGFVFMLLNSLYVLIMLATLVPVLVLAPCIS